MFKKFYLFLSLLIFFLLTEKYSYSENNYGGVFLKIPVAAMPSGLSEAYTSMVGADSVLYNPAGTGLLTYSALSATHNRYFEGINQTYITSTIYTPYGNFSAFYSVLASGDITSYDSNENITGNTNTSHKLYGITYSKGFPYFEYAAKKIDPMLITPSWTRIKPVKVYIPKVYRASFGFTVKKVEERLDTESSSSVLFDVGGILVLPGHFHIGTSVQNIGKSMKFYTQKEKIPVIFRFGVAKDFATVKDIMNFIFTADYVKSQDTGSYFNFGFEDDIAKAFQARIGYTTREKEGSALSFGIGMNFDRLISKESLVKGFRMDYAFVNYGVLGPTHRIGFQLVW